MGLTKVEIRAKKKARVRKNIFGTAERPRLTVFKSLKHIYAQIVDDSTGKTLVAVSTRTKEFDGARAVNKEAAKKVGQMLATKAIKLEIKKIAFDRNGFLYHGRIQSLADGAREAGLEF